MTNGTIRPWGSASFGRKVQRKVIMPGPGGKGQHIVDVPEQVKMQIDGIIFGGPVGWVRRPSVLSRPSTAKSRPQTASSARSENRRVDWVVGRPRRPNSAHPDTIAPLGGAESPRLRMRPTSAGPLLSRGAARTARVGSPIMRRRSGQTGEHRPGSAMSDLSSIGDVIEGIDERIMEDDEESNAELDSVGGSEALDELDVHDGGDDALPPRESSSFVLVGGIS